MSAADANPLIVFTPTRGAVGRAMGTSGRSRPNRYEQTKTDVIHEPQWAET